MDETETRGAPPPLGGWKRGLISGFILFHWACVAAWLWPNPSDVKSFLLSIRAPLPGRGAAGWDLAPRSVAVEYLLHTAQHQDWSMFAPNPLQINRYVAATVTFRDGRREEFGFPRVSQLGFFQGWLDKRYRKYQHRIADEPSPAFREDLARYIARRMNRADNPPVRVTIYDYQSPIPRHDRPKPEGWVDYPALLRRESRFHGVLLLDYRVRPGDLP